MKISELRNKTEEELENLIFKKRDEIRKLRFGGPSQKLKDVKMMNKTKKEIARILTTLKEKCPKKN